MQYKGKAIEVLNKEEVFGETIAWIHILESNEFKKVSIDEIEESANNYSLAHIRFAAIAAKIKDEVARKNILAPYESSLIPLPHQILVLEKVMQSGQNRYLLADEVGMGKTIETGLILKELKLRGDIKRILVIVPKSAMMQWQSELKEHFNEQFHIYDSQMINSMSRNFSSVNADQEFNFWEQHNQIIVSIDALKPLDKRQGWPQERVDEYNKYRMEGVLNANFDMVVIDEVHKMGGASQTVSRYILAQALCNTVENALLLSATPHRGKSDHFRRILQLLDPDAFDGEGLPSIEELESYVIRTEKRLALDYEGVKLFNERETIRFDVSLDLNRHSKQLALYDEVTQYVIKGFNSAKKSKNKATGLIMVLFQRLVSSSTAAILSAMEGRLYRLQNGDDTDVEVYYDEIDSLGEEAFTDVSLDCNNASNTECLVDEEVVLSNLIEQAKECMLHETDAKLEAFINKYKELQQASNNPDLKVIIFTEFRTTQKMLKDILELRGYRCSKINGSQDLDDRKFALSQFKNESQILIATDAAGESLNMQFCNIVINYDLPWNPMMIEQRIGRVDRIGQKEKVKAFNMLTNNSVDLRVYEVIEEKLSNILSQLGIDKSSDVLDSTLDSKSINKLYLRSLLDPSHFEFAGDSWLNEIRGKLNNYHSTESILPQVKEEEIEYKKAADVKHSPLPVWLEDLVVQYALMHDGKVEKNIHGYIETELDGKSKNYTFESEVAMNNPDVEHLSLQHDLVRKILNDIREYDRSREMPVLSSSEEETAGVWSLWEISAENNIERKLCYQAFFIADNKQKIFPAYANDIWTRLLNRQTNFKYSGKRKIEISDNEILESSLLNSYKNIETELIDLMNSKKTNKIRSYEYQSSRISKIGIANIRESRMKRLDEENESWMQEYESNKKVLPGIKHLISVKIDA